MFDIQIIVDSFNYAIVKLADITWPIERTNLIKGLRLDCAFHRRWICILSLLHELLHENRDILDPFSKWWQEYRAALTQSLQQGSAKASYRCLGLNILFRSGDEPHVYVHVLLSPNWLDSSVFKDSQNPGLGVFSHIPYLVEE